MTRDELYAKLQTPEGMALFRRTIADHYAWLTHDARFERLVCIRKTGIQPRNPERPEENLVSGVRPIACLNPVGSIPAGSSSSGLIFRLGLRSRDLPASVTLDWSYPANRSLRHISEEQIRQLGEDGAILYVVDGTGAVASYEPIPATVLRVCTRGKHGRFPSTWRMLADVRDEEIMAIVPS
jgi:hypothetical protein